MIRNFVVIIQTAQLHLKFPYEKGIMLSGYVKYNIFKFGNVHELLYDILENN